jgi:hypothetical protein
MVTLELDTLAATSGFELWMLEVDGVFLLVSIRVS